MKKNSLYILFLLLLLGACQKEATPVPTKGKLKKITETIDASSKNTTEFVYDQAGKLIQINSASIENDKVIATKKEEFIRNSQGIITKIKTSKSANNQQIDTEKLITYNQDDNITKIVEYNKTNSNQIIEQIAYATDDLGLSRPSFYDKLELRNIRDSLFAFIPLIHSEFTWLRGNVESIKTQDIASNNLKEYTYTYDTNSNNPLAILYENDIKLPNVLALSKNQLQTLIEYPENITYRFDNFSVLFRATEQKQFKQNYGRWFELKNVSYEYW